MKEFTKEIFAEAQVSPVKDEDAYKTLTANLLEKLDKKSTEDSFVQVYADLKTASSEPIHNGRPKMLHITAIIVHEGINLNGDGFYAEDLERSVSEKKLFKDGYGGMIDINHDFSPVGYWYDAEYVIDPETETGCIVAKGAIWAWRFPEVADKMLADQHRDGKIVVSMTCVCASEDVSYAMDPTGRYVSWNKNPVFVATTILFDMPAGDQNARAVAEEDPVHITEQERKQTLLKAAAKIDNDKRNTEELQMLDELKPILEAKLGENAENVINSITAALANLEAKLDENKSQLEDAETKIANLEEQNTDLQTTIEEQTLALENLTSAKEEMETLIDTQKETISGYEAREEAAAFEATRQARLAEVSDGVLEKLAAKDPAVREAIENRWASQSDEEWEVTKAEHALANTQKKEILPGVSNHGASLKDFLR